MKCLQVTEEAAGRTTGEGATESSSLEAVRGGGDEEVATNGNNNCVDVLLMIDDRQRERIRQTLN